jgi:hypothetical protein
VTQDEAYAGALATLDSLERMARKVAVEHEAYRELLEHILRILNNPDNERLLPRHLVIYARLWQGQFEKIGGGK